MLKKGQLYQVLILGALFAVQLSMFYFGLSKSNASRGTLIVNLLPFWILWRGCFYVRRKERGNGRLPNRGSYYSFSHYHLVLQHNLLETNHQRLQRISNNPVFNGFCSARLFFKIVGAVLYQSLITATFGFVTWNKLLQKYGAVALHSFIFIMPIAGVALGGLVLGEPITSKLLIALTLIVAGILVVHLKPRKEAPVYPIRKGI
jgi:drug/metabolite transporter (DMT)-like permease